MTVETTIGKKYAIHLPRTVVRALNIQEGDKILLRISGDALALESVQDPLQLELSSKKFASVDPEEIEKTSLQERIRKVNNHS